MAPKALRSCLALLAALAGAGVGGAARAEPSAFDVVGLRLGMSVEEAAAALRSYDSAIVLNEARQRYVYSDGVNHNLETPAFVAYLEGSRKIVDGNAWGYEAFIVYFSPLPKGQRATFVKRTQSAVPNPPTGRQYNDALIEKYGQPASVDATGLRWTFPANRVDCTVGTGTYDPSRGNFLRYVFEGGVPGRFHKRDVTDLSKCASFLEYQTGVPDGPAAYVTARMIDVEATAQGEIEASAWVAKLAEDARKAREGAAVKPKL